MVTQRHASTPGADSARRAEAWEYARALSPRRTIRVADVDVDGTILNTYSRGRRISAEPPTSTWALNLTDTAGLFHYLAFDLDTSHGRADLDARKLRIWLDDLGIDYLEAASGPSGGRHVWLGLATPAPAPLVDAIARLAQTELPSLDISPLTNAVTGACRPPLAPHRAGGRSEVLAGWLDRLASRTVELEQLQQLHAMLAALHGARPIPRRSAAMGRARADVAGNPVLNVPRRPLGAAARHLLEHGQPAVDDSSRTLASALARCALAGMTFAEILELAATSPAFEHVRTVPWFGDSRRERSAADARALLERQWKRTIAWASATPRLLDGDDPSFDARAGAIAAIAIAAQERAAAMPGRWRAGGGRYSDRLVLDAICLIALQAMRADVEVSTRRLSELTGLGRESCRTAVLRLAADGWIAQEAPHEGTKAPRWRLRDFSTGGVGNDRSQVPPPPAPPGHGTALRNATLKRLRTTLELLAHDVFAAPHSLGRTAGRTYAQLLEDEILGVSELATRTGLPATSVRRSLARLVTHHLIDRADAGYYRTPPDRREAASAALHVAGYLAERRRRYLVEREAWAWWQAELERRHTRRRRRRRRANEPQLYTVDGEMEYPVHPKRRDGRADFAAALRAVRDGVLEAPDIFDGEAA